MTELGRAALKERERNAWSAVADDWHRHAALLRKGAVRAQCYNDWT